jgi:hypothetical protein
MKVLIQLKDSMKPGPIPNIQYTQTKTTLDGVQAYRNIPVSTIVSTMETLSSVSQNIPSKEKSIVTPSLCLNKSITGTNGTENYPPNIPSPS